MTKLYRMKPLVWEQEPEFGSLVCNDRFRIHAWPSPYALTQDPDSYRSRSRGQFGSLEKAKAAAEKLALEEALRWVEEVTPEAPRWIPVGERMPPDDPNDQQCSVNVMVVTKYGDIYWAWWSKDVSDWHDYDGIVSRVTHWMPLPQPPNGGA